MKVLYDISVLGLGFQIAKARTGVFRVIENVAFELAKVSECELTFCGTIDLKNLTDCQSYLEVTPALASVPLATPRFLERRLKIDNKKARLIKNLYEDPNTGIAKKVMTKLNIKQLMAADKILANGETNLIPASAISSSEIYHSPFYAIPPYIKAGGKHKQFLTCYDLIPILYPQFCDDHVVSMITKILETITRETWVLCISDSTRNDLLNFLGDKVDPEKVIVTELAASNLFYQSVDKARNQEVKSRHNIPEGQYILSLCTFEPRKNIEQAIRAFVRLVQESGVNDLFLVLVGTKGWKFDAIFDEIATIPGIRDKIIITGFVADEDLAAIYSDALFFVYPSHYEGFGLPPLEAMQCGIPVITSNVSSLPEVVGEAGIMVSPNDLDELCEAMLSLYRNAEMRTHMAEQSLMQAARFSWKRCAAETVTAYRTSLL